MELLLELYLYILILANDINVTKKLRSLTKLSLFASDQYYNHKKLNIHYDYDKWMISDVDYIKLQEIIKNRIFRGNSLMMFNHTFNDSTAFNITIKDFYILKI